MLHEGWWCDVLRKNRYIFQRKHRGNVAQGDYNNELLPQPTNPSVASYLFSWESVGVFQLFVPLYFAMSERISAEKQQEVVGWIASASMAELEYKVSPKQQHLSLFIVFDLVLIASFHYYFFHPPWFRIGVDGPASSWLQFMDMLP